MTTINSRKTVTFLINNVANLNPGDRIVQVTGAGVVITRRVPKYTHVLASEVTVGDILKVNGYNSFRVQSIENIGDSEDVLRFVGEDRHTDREVQILADDTVGVKVVEEEAAE